MGRARTAAVCLAVLVTGCTAGSLTDGDAVAACRDEVPAAERPNLRMTVGTDAPSQWHVRLWTDTPRAAGSPTESPNYVCVASGRGGEVVVDSFARTRQRRDIPVDRLCDQLVPLADVSAALASRRDAGPSLVAVQQTLPDPLPQQPAELAQALQRLVAEVGPAARAASRPEATVINAGDFADWPGLAARVEQACG